jgi:hypothetical protein
VRRGLALCPMSFTCNGGVRDNPDQDAQNQRVANANRGDGTLGGTLYGGGYGVATYDGHPVNF